VNVHVVVHWKEAIRPAFPVKKKYTGIKHDVTSYMLKAAYIHALT